MSFRGKRGTLETSIVSLRGKGSTRDVSSRRVVLVRIAMSGLHEAVTTCNSVAGLRCYDM